MGQLILLRRPSTLPRPAVPAAPPGAQPEPAGAAQGILLALALSSLAWVGLALLVRHLW